ncbi:hypothetical protein BDZ97DRAFT_1835234 [Flammula alnicola]|nr:hypothetical protein BDZ97DRAFT_1835234 [Flammula alnicola]
MDLLPYPDVFDLDMYYGPGSGRDSLSTQDCSSSSIIICSTEDKDLFSLLDLSLPSNSDHIPTRSARRFGFVAAPSSPQSPSVSVDHEVKRYRDLYRHPAYSRPPDLYSENTSLESLMNVTPPAHNKAPVSGSASRALLPLPLRDANRTTNIPSRPLIPARKVGKVHFETTPPRPLKLVKSHLANPPPPIVIVSHHRCGSISEDSRYTMKVNNSEGSQETLRARLREACANFSKSVWTEDSYSLDISIR